MKKLVGEGKPFHSAVDKTAALLKRKVGTGAEFMKELMGVSGVKPTELQERGLTEIMGMPRMTHDQFMANLATRPAPKIREKVLGGDRSEPDSEAPYHEKWTLPGGENYREMLIKAPETKFSFDAPPQFGGDPNHFGGESGILASMRLKDRLVPDLEGPHNVKIIGGGGASNKKFNTREEANAFADVKHQGGYKTEITPLNNKKYLHLEELQSDWHQQGRDKGYKDPQAEQKFKQVDDLRRTFFELNKRRRELHEQAKQEPDYSPKFQSMMDEANGITPKLLELNSQIHDLEHLKKQQQDAVPDAPFKKNWEEMALKRLIHHAAEKGYHGVVVTPGAEQAERYNIGNHIGQLNADEYDIAGDRQWRINAKDKSGKKVPISSQYLTDEELAGHVGKELANKIITDRGGEYSGLDLHIGGEGMKAFYDKKVPNILNSIGKKYGVKTHLGGHNIPINNGMLEPQEGGGYKQTPPETKALHHFPITEEMRKDVLTNGLPLYNKGGTVHMADGGDMDQMQLAMMDKKVKKPKKPPTPLHFAPAPALSKKDIEAHAERITRQMAGLDNPNNKTLQQLAREQNLQVDIRSGGPKSNLPVIDYSKLGKNAFTVGVPGDPSIGGLVPHDQTDERHSMEYPKAGEYLRGIGGEQLSSEVPMYGGYMYGGYGHPAGWASDLGASRGMFNVVQKLAKEDPSREIYGHYHKMTPESLNHAVHFLDALMTHSQLHNLTEEQRNMLNHLMREVQTTTNKKHRPYPSFPGFENPADVMAHAHLSSDMRKKMISLIGKEKYLPGGTQRLDDVIFAASHPELRNIETGAGGNAIIKFDPKGNLKKSLSLHPTYGHDIPSQTIGQTRYTTPFQILAPRSHHRAVTQIAAMGKKVEPFNMAKMSIIREPIDEQYINQMGQYEQAMRKRLGYKKGGKIKMADGGQVDIKNIGVNEAPDMDVKQYFMPRPMTSNVFPVGGVQQAPQAPQQMQQPPQGQQGMQGMPQGQAPFQPPQAPPRQPPSNILQMTPQGQAMSAMTPPKPMARGGHVDRDTMMLELMNRKTKVKHG